MLLASGPPRTYGAASMQGPVGTARDPLPWCLALCMAFLALCLHRLGTPSKIYFDEVHYVIAARKLLDGIRANPEHPMFGKEVIAAAIAVLGDRPWAWRIPMVIFGTLGLHAFGRFIWHLSYRPFATVAAMFLLATNFLWFIESRIAMLDMVQAGLGMVALWQFAALIRAPASRPRVRLAVCAITMGLSLGAKWSIAPVLVLPGLTFLILRMRERGWKIVGMRGAGPVPGISLAEAAFWLGLLPLAIYWLTFLPGFFWTERPIDPLGFITHHEYMLQLQDSVKRLHPYRSVWYQWVANWRAIWYLYEFVDGAQRGIVLLGNPFSMLAGLPALLWCLWIGLRRHRWDALALVALYVITLGIWAVNGKPIQFYYHYLLPASFLMGCLALALDALWARTDKWRWTTPVALAAAGAMFLYFYPVISAARLDGKRAFEQWTWLPTWR